VHHRAPACRAQPLLKEFHEDTTSDKAELEKAVTDGGFADWQTYYMQFARQWTANPERPTLGPWRALGTLSAELFQIERNPYFFAVDGDGQQLPYIDTVSHRLFENDEVKNLWVTNGEIDMQYRHMQIADLPLYKASEEQGGYKTILGVSASHVAMQLNLSTKNELLNEFFNQRDVRIAISHAINRDRSPAGLQRLVQPRQYSPLPMSRNTMTSGKGLHRVRPGHVEKLLDDLGYVKGADGIRLHKDARRRSASSSRAPTRPARRPRTPRCWLPRTWRRSALR